MVERSHGVGISDAQQAPMVHGMGMVNDDMTTLHG